MENHTNGKIPPQGVDLLAYHRELAQSNVPPETILRSGSFPEMNDGANTHEILGDRDEEHSSP